MNQLNLVEKTKLKENIISKTVKEKIRTIDKQLTFK